MTPAQAREILANWKHGVQHYPAAVITAALIATGDLAPALN